MKNFSASKLRKLGFNKVSFSNDFTLYVNGYGFYSNGNTIEWDGGEDNGLPPLRIKEEKRFHRLIEGLTGKRLSELT